MTDPSKDIKDAFRMARGMIRICQHVGGPCMTERNGEPFYDCAFSRIEPVQLGRFSMSAIKRTHGRLRHDRIRKIGRA